MTWLRAVAVLAALSACLAKAESAPSKSAPACSDRVSAAITLIWSTESEESNLGFDLFRADRRQGPYARINPELIEGHGTTAVPQEYRFVDRRVEHAKPYFYYLESISYSGERQRYSSVIRGIDDRPRCAETAGVGRQP